MKGVSALQRRPKRADNGHFEPVKNPGDPETKHHEQVKAAPGQPIQPKGNIGLHSAGGRGRTRSVLHRYCRLIGCRREIGLADGPGDDHLA
jgi:hypothetical protein